MNIWEKVTGSDMSKEFKDFEKRVKRLPTDYQEVWQQINDILWQSSDFSGRNLMPVFDGVLSFFEETAADGKSVKEALGNDINNFCSELTGDEGNSYRDKLRLKLNKNIARKIDK